MRDLTRTLTDWLQSGGNQVGQVQIRAISGGWELRHVDDAAAEGLKPYAGAEAARALANFDEAGAFRPLKTAPTLPRGWVLRIDTAGELRLALNYFYPAMIGCAVSHERGELKVLPLRETLARQTGMYRITQKVTDLDARETVDRFCSGCLKHRLWEIAELNPQPCDTAPGTWPLLCQEACNLLVPEIRKVVKSKPADA